MKTFLMRWRRSKFLLLGLLCVGAVAFLGPIFQNLSVGSSDKSTPATSAPITDKNKDENEPKTIEYDQHEYGERVAEAKPAAKQQEPDGETDYLSIQCRINGRKRVPCLMVDTGDKTEDLEGTNNEVFLPFHAFLKPQFEVTGGVVADGGGQYRFDWWHSNARFHLPEEGRPYDVAGPFGPFGGFTVETRDRVRCISGVHGVPMSIQWREQPYYYPIQVAQYGLQHYSRNITERTAGNIEVNSEWLTAPDFRKATNINKVMNTVEIDSPALLDNPGAFVKLEDQALHEISFRLEFLDEQASITVTVEWTDTANSDTKQFIAIHFLQTEDKMCFSAVSPHAYSYAIGKRKGVFTFTRNLLVDLHRALAAAETSGVSGKKKSKILQQQRRKVTANNIRLVSLGLRGHVRVIGPITQRSTSHWQHFLDSAEWLMSAQDSRGGWPVPVKRVLAGGQLVMEPGWYSAMAQGHGMSMLSRAFVKTADIRYLEAAKNALELFDVPAEKGGVLNHFAGVYPWYEEYPTTPGTFVLNGFIYSLLGLNDLAMAEEKVTDKQQTHTHGNTTTKARDLYRRGLKSLRALLPLYDTGSGSSYDLRHFSLSGTGTFAPNLARWDYHSVHVDLLMWLYTIEGDPMFKAVADRWIDYSRGKRARHN